MEAEQLRVLMDYFGSGRWTAQEVAIMFVPHLSEESQQSYFEAMMEDLAEEQREKDEAYQ
jgi:hypothetical protein